MTLLDINNQLVDFFLNEEKFSLTDNIKDIHIPETYTEYTRNIIVAGLDNLVNNGMLIKLNDDLYILKQPINSFNQSVILSPNIASAITDKVNMLSTEDDEEDTCNVLNITEEDIIKLLIIIDTLLEQTGKAP